ncbi:MAG: hypothetical protein EP301_02455 [Gammaproteobacteria bacterium]|nr:MAG: hypothetical protein EP301_02455 [Gammaproteobacteria bacterium]
MLKLAQDLMIGEDERGQTVLSPAREDALLRITSKNGCLTLQAMAMDWTFSEDGGLSLQHLTFVEGLTLKLSFPSSSLILTPDFQAAARARVDREIHLMPTDSPTLALIRVDEPVTLIEQQLLPSPEAVSVAPLAPEDLEIEEATVQALAADALNHWDHQVPDEQAERQQTPEPEMPVPVTAPAAQPETTPAIFEEVAPEVSAQALARKTHRPLAGLIAAAALLAPMYLFLVDGHKLGIDFPLTNYLPLETAAVPTSNSAVQASPAPAHADTAMTAESVSSTLEPLPAAMPVGQEASVPIETSLRSWPDEQPSTEAAQQQLLIASLLAEAKAFYNAGLIVTPTEANAVSHLTQVLGMDPTNEEGLRLMYMSAVTLIKEAEAAYAAGDNYLARNLVEDVLGFHPEFDDARALLDSWTRVPEG